MADQTNAEVSDERLRIFAESLSDGEWTSALLKAYNPTGAVSVTYEQAKAALVADLTRRSVTSQASEGEVATLRSIIAKCAAALGNGAFIDPERASVEFMSNLPAEIEAVVASPSKRVERLEAALKDALDKLAIQALQGGRS